MKQITLFIALIAIIINSSCSLFNRGEDVDKFCIDTVSVYLTELDTIYEDAVYTTDIIDSSWAAFLGWDSTLTHFDSTIIINKIASDDSLVSELYGFPLVFKTDGPDTEVTFLGGYLNGWRGPLPEIAYSLPPPDYDVSPECDSIVYDTVYFPDWYSPSYAIFEIQSEGVTTIDTVIFGTNGYIDNIFHTAISGNNTGSEKHDYLLTEFLSNSDFTRSELHSMFDHNIINSPETYEVYFIDIYSHGGFPTQPTAVDLKFYIRKFN